MCARHQRARYQQDQARRGSASERGYGSRWQKARETFLSNNPLCVQCEGYGRITPARVVDHVVPHRGDQDLFWDSDNWQALCDYTSPWNCHGRKSAVEDGGFGSAAVLPPGIRPSRIPLTLVAGSPGSGKSTLVAQLAAPTDLVLDLDVIRARIAGRRIYEAGEETLSKALRERNAQLARLSDAAPPWPRAWLIATAPTPAARRWWRKRAGANVIVLETPLERCLEWIRRDARRADKERFSAAARSWWSTYRPDPADEVRRVQ